MLSHFFKKEVIFCFKNNHDWTIISFYTPMQKWKEALKNTLGILCADNLYFDDYIFGQSTSEIQEISIHADIADVMIEFLSNRHGFTQGHPGSSESILNTLNSDNCYYKKVTEKQFYAFLNDLEQLQLVPTSSEIENSLFEHLKSFDDF